MSQNNCYPTTAHTDLDINNIRARLNNGGDLFWDLIGWAAYEVPINSGKHPLFASAIWIGGVDNSGQLKIAAQTYRQSGNDYFAGPLDKNANTDMQTCIDWDQMWKINKTTIDSFKLGLFGSIPKSILEWPAKDNPNNSLLSNFAGNEYAPFNDYNQDGKYDAKDGDYPKILGDQAIWWIFNDAGNQHTETNGMAIGVEVHAMAFAYQGNQVDNRTTFYQYNFINRSTVGLDEMYVSHWFDADLGCHQDDYIGCDTTRDMAIVYNGDAFDQQCGSNGYGSDPPILAISIVCGMRDNSGKHMGMSSFMTYRNDFTTQGNPVKPTEYFNYMKSIWKDNTHLTDGGNGYGGSKNVNYFFPSDPKDTTGWSECSLNNAPSDTRFLLSSGHVTFSPGDSKKITYAIVWNKPTGVYPCPSFSGIQSDVDKIKSAFNCYFYSGVDQNSFAYTETGLVIVNDPVNNLLLLKLTDEGNAFQEFELFDVSGRAIIKEQEMNSNTITLNTNAYYSGIFIYKAIDIRGDIRTGKVMIVNH